MYYALEYFNYIEVATVSADKPNMLLILILFLLPFLLSSYDDEVDKVNQYQRLSLEDLEKIEIGKF